MSLLRRLTNLHLPKLKVLKLTLRRPDRITGLPPELINAILRQPQLHPRDLVSFSQTSRASYAVVVRLQPLLLQTKQRRIQLSLLLTRLAALTYSHRAALLTQIYPKLFDDILSVFRDLYGNTTLHRDDWPDWECRYEQSCRLVEERWSCKRLTRDLLEIFASWTQYRNEELWETESGRLEFLDREPPPRERDYPGGSSGGGSGGGGATRRRITALKRRALRQRKGPDPGMLTSLAVQWKRGTTDYRMVMIKRFADGDAKIWILGETVNMRRARVRGSAGSSLGIAPAGTDYV